MKNFIFKSNASDLQKMFSILENLQKNMVYSTYKLDNILKLIKEVNTDNRLQHQVDMYFDDNGEAHLGNEPKTSPQTDSETKWEDSSEHVQ